MSWKQSLHIWVCKSRWQLSWDTADSINYSLRRWRDMLHRSLCSDPLSWFWNLWCGDGALTQSPCWRRETFCCEGTNVMIQHIMMGCTALIFIVWSFLSSTSRGQILRIDLPWSHRQNLNHPNPKKSNHAGFLADSSTKGQTTLYGWLDSQGGSLHLHAGRHTQQWSMPKTVVQKHHSL